MGNNNTKKSLRDVIHENHQCIKQAKKQLERFDKLRKAMQLNEGACTKVVQNLSPSDENLKEAYKRLNGMGFNPDLAEKPKGPKKEKKRNRLNKVIRGKLQI